MTISCNLHFFKHLRRIIHMRPVRIRVRIGPPHPLVCRKKELNGEVLWMKPEKPRPLCRSWCGTIQILPCLKALSTAPRPKFCSLLPAMVTSPYNCISENSWAGRKTVYSYVNNSLLNDLLIWILIINYYWKHFQPIWPRLHSPLILTCTVVVFLKF
jgi:hypothetical protein